MTEIKWATVTAVGPLRVKIDGDSSALLITPESLVDPAALAVNDRVRVSIDQRQLIVLGRSGGPAAASTTRVGPVELATTAETEALTDTGRAVTPAGLASTVGRISTLESTKAQLWYARKTNTDWLGTSLADVSNLSISFSLTATRTCLIVLHFIASDGASGGGRTFAPEFMLDGSTIANAAALLPAAASNRFPVGGSSETRAGTVSYVQSIGSGAHTLKVRAIASAAPAVTLNGSILVLTTI